MPRNRPSRYGTVPGSFQALAGLEAQIQAIFMFCVWTHVVPRPSPGSSGSGLVLGSKILLRLSPVYTVFALTKITLCGAVGNVALGTAKVVKMMMKSFKYVKIEISIVVVLFLPVLSSSPLFLSRLSTKSPLLRQSSD